MKVIFENSHACSVYPALNVLKIFQVVYIITKKNICFLPAVFLKAQCSWKKILSRFCGNNDTNFICIVISEKHSFFSFLKVFYFLFSNSCELLHHWIKNVY